MAEILDPILCPAGLLSSSLWRGLGRTPWFSEKGLKALLDSLNQARDPFISGLFLACHRKEGIKQFNSYTTFDVDKMAIARIS
ncbi:hypothetical protein [Prochlorococcus marinus]|uniref:hypothetical protein n=1 Tax=Prochlorococcus marinus TaxID=1219 RepID=UPI001F15C056|nr:hypothetical protein [Prochlorococcus marinus]